MFDVQNFLERIAECELLARQTKALLESATGQLSRLRKAVEELSRAFPGQIQEAFKKVPQKKG